MDTDPLRTYDEAEDRRLATNLIGVTAAVYQGKFKDRHPDLLLLCDLHAALFDGVRSHAGRIRRHGSGSETLTFGPNRSMHRDDVPEALDKVFAHIQTQIDHLDRNWGAEDYELAAISTAVWAHAKVIHIHPFEDGNGRTGRLFMNVVLVRLGLRPVALDVPKEEYRRCLNRFYRTGELQPLLDLVIGSWA